MPLVLTVDPHHPDPAALRRAADLLVAGRLVAFPTETVYGLGANALDADAVARLFAVKGRPAEDPVIVHVLGLEDLAGIVAEIPPLARRLAAAFWPGPLTLVLPRGPALPAAVSAGLDSVAVRAPAHPVARALIAAAGLPVAAPSANRFSRASPTTAQHVVDDLGDAVDLVLDGGPADVGLESTVLDLRSEPPRLLRPGGLTLERLRGLVGEVLVAGPEAGSGPRRSPGQMARHYAPRARLVLVAGPEAALPEALATAAARLQSAGHVVGLLVAEEDSLAPATGRPVVALGSCRDLAPVARRLFAALRQLDAAGATVILARDWGAAGLGLALRDRLARAAEGRVVQLGADQVADVAAIVAAGGGEGASASEGG